MNAQPTIPEDCILHGVVNCPSPSCNVQTTDPSKFEGFAVIASRAASLGFLVHPITPGLKEPPLLSGFQLKATSDLNQIDIWAQQFPQANAGAMATPDGHIFLDEDNVPRIHELYRAKYGEDYPRTYATESRKGHRQTAWLQTDATRALGNAVQGSTKELVMSVRQKNYYVMVAGSIHPDTREPYRVVDDSPIIAMPDRLVEFIQWLKAERKNEIAEEKRAKAAEKSDNDVPASVAPVATAYVDDSNDTESDQPLLDADRTYGEGERNNILSRYAYRRYIRELCTEEELRADVYEFNERHCSPPEDRHKVDKIIAGKLSMKPLGCGILRDGVLEPRRKLTAESIAEDARVGAAFLAEREANRPLAGATVEDQLQEIKERVKENPDAPVPSVNFNLLITKSASPLTY